MTVCAVVNLSTMLVDNMIEASESDPCPEGWLFKQDPPDFVTVGTAWDGVAFVNPKRLDPTAPSRGLELI